MANLVNNGFFLAEQVLTHLKPLTVAKLPLVLLSSSRQTAYASPNAGGRWLLHQGALDYAALRC